MRTIKITKGRELVSKTEFSGVSESTKEELQKFIDSIPGTRFLYPHSPPNPEWKFFSFDGRGKPDAAAWWRVEAAKQCGSSTSIAESALREVRMRVYGTQYDRAWDPTRTAAYYAVGDVIQDTLRGSNIITGRVTSSWLAAGDAALYAYYILTRDMDFPGRKEYYDHVKARWNVWQKGYGLAGDVNGVLYAYDFRPYFANNSVKLRV